MTLTKFILCIALILILYIFLILTGKALADSRNGTALGVFPFAKTRTAITLNVEAGPAVSVEANGHVVCLRVSHLQQKRLEAYNYWGMYLALCARHRKVR